MILSTLSHRSSRISWLTRRALTTTYYDSQSGLHVPVHNDGEISAFVDLGSDFDAFATVESLLSALQEKFGTLKSAGIQGAALPPLNLLLEKNETLVVAASLFPHFNIFVPSRLSPKEITSYPDNINLMFQYNDDSTLSPVSLSDCVANGTKTTIALLDSCYYRRDPIEVANGVASLIDDTGGGDFVWLAEEMPRAASAEEIIKLCEELSYLDVSGPTMKSRLVVDLRHSGAEETAEECMLMGVNKFVVDEQRLEWLQDMVDENGKELKR
jgi:hypothetical protein